MVVAVVLTVLAVTLTRSWHGCLPDFHHSHCPRCHPYCCPGLPICWIPDSWYFLFTIVFSITTYLLFSFYYIRYAWRALKVTHALRARCYDVRATYERSNNNNFWNVLLSRRVSGPYNSYRARAVRTKKFLKKKPGRNKRLPNASLQRLLRSKHPPMDGKLLQMQFGS